MGEEMAHKLIQLVNDSGILAQKSIEQLGSAHDVFEYLIRVRDGEMAGSAHFDDTTLAKPYRQLVQWLLERSSPVEP
jgi:hypothetical protein